ncbi:MAG TPA: TonB-dependent receptor plug domain-containing protein, partial [Myxococcaceae bacterium]|nr:TonB-dependent receptor plug domain-containing protein [Myxococcaceae bacterium]
MTVVSSTGTLQALNEAPSIVSVITKEQIRQFGLFTLADALQQMPGTTVLINEFGDKIVAARGLSSSPNILVLLDGERLNDFYDGSTPYTYPLANIERIEMIRGPGSALYGTNALSAVISMFSKQPSRGTSLELTGEVLPENSVSLGGRAAFLSAFESSHYGILASGNF